MPAGGMVRGIGFGSAAGAGPDTLKAQAMAMPGSKWIMNRMVSSYRGLADAARSSVKYAT